MTTLSIDEQISWTERELEFMHTGLNNEIGTYDDDIPIIRAILQSLNKLKELQK